MITQIYPLSPHYPQLFLIGIIFIIFLWIFIINIWVIKFSAEMAYRKGGVGTWIGALKQWIWIILTNILLFIIFWLILSLLGMLIIFKSLLFP